MIESLYSEFDTDLTVRVIKGKSFDENRVDLLKIKKIEGVSEAVRAVEETVILKKCTSVGMHEIHCATQLLNHSCIQLAHINLHHPCVVD